MTIEPWMAAAAGAVALLVVSRTIGGGKAPSRAVSDRLAAGAQVVDVRTPREYARGAYPGAVNIPLADLGDRLHQLSRERPVVLYCRSGARSRAGARLLRRAGYGDVLNAGGLDDMPRPGA